MEGEDGLSHLQGQSHTPGPARGSGVGVEEVIEGSIRHQFNDEQKRRRGIGRGGEAQEIYQAGAVERGENQELVLSLVGAARGALDGELTAGLEHGLVDGAVTAPAEESGGGEVGSGGDEIGVVESVQGRRGGGGGGSGGVFIGGGGGGVGVGFGEFVGLDWRNGGDGAARGDGGFGAAREVPHWIERGKRGGGKRSGSRSGDWRREERRGEE